MSLKKTGCESCEFTGFLMIEDYTGKACIEKCDLCNTFKSDNEAVGEVFRLACMMTDMKRNEGSID